MCLYDSLVQSSNSVSGNNSGNSRNGKYLKKNQTEHGESVIDVPRDRNGSFEPIVVPKYERWFVHRKACNLSLRQGYERFGYRRGDA